MGTKRRTRHGITPSPAASQIRDHVAFWHGVQAIRAAGWLPGFGHARRLAGASRRGFGRGQTRFSARNGRPRRDT